MRLLTLLALGSLASAAPTLPDAPDPATDSITFGRPVPHPLGTVQLSGPGGGRVPALGLALESGAGDHLAGRPNRLPVLKVSLQPGQSARLSAVYSDLTGWVLVPRGWVAVVGGVGADGSGVLAFTPTAHDRPAEWLLFSSTGACVGCALSAASPFFPRWRAESLRQGFGTLTPDVPLKVVPLAASSAALFSYRKPGAAYTTHGVAAYGLDGGDIAGFRAVYATLRDRALAGSVLNFALKHPW